jgi:RNA polymerase sigma-70 factor (ECF subfamily)
VTRAPSVRQVDSFADVDDATLVERALRGERWSEEALYRRHARRLHDVATRVLGRMSDAEDAVQDAFLTAFTNLKDLRDPARFEAWLYRILLNSARGKLRRRRLMRSLGLDRGEDDGALAQTASPSAPPDALAELARIDRVLSSVSAEARLVWVLNRVEGWSLGEIAEALDISLPTAKRRGWHVEAKLAEHLKVIDQADVELEPSTKEVAR